MDEFKFSNVIENKQNDKTISIIGKIDTDVLASNKAESVYYSFPLIERMVLEIYKLVPESDIEHYEQGKFRTIIPIIEENNKNDDEKIIPEDIVNLIQEIFKEDGPRNKILHVKNENVEITVFFQQINYIIMRLLDILKHLIEESDMYKFKKIEKLV